MPNTTEISIGTEGAKRSIQELQAVVDGLESKLKSIAGTLNAGSATPADTAQFFGTASQLSGARAQMANAITGSATTGGGGTPFDGGNAFSAPGFKMQKLGDVQAATNFVMQNTSGATRETLMAQVLSGSVPMPLGGGSSGAVSNPLNPFAGAAPTGPSTLLKAPGWQRLEYEWQQSQKQEAQDAQAAQQQALGLRAFGAATGYEAARFGGQLAGAYTQAITSGQPQPMAYGAAYGGAAGFGIGAGIGFAFGGPIGAAIGGTVGSSLGAPLINALQATSVRNAQIAESLIPTALQNGLDPSVMARQATAISDQANNAYLDKSGWSWENARKGAALGSSGNVLTMIGGAIIGGLNPGNNIQRGLGVYAGIDQSDPHDVAGAMASLNSGYLQSGIDPNSQNAEGQVAALLARFPAAGSKGAAARASAMGRVQGAMAKTGGNLTDLAAAVGLPDLLTASPDMDAATRAALIQANAAIPAAERRSGLAASGSDAARSGYDGSIFSGASTRGRTGGFNAMLGAMESQLGAETRELSAIEASPDGASSPKAAAKRAMIASLHKEIAGEYNRRAQGIVGDIESGSGVNIAGANSTMARANLYGAANEFAAPVAGLRNALTSEAQGLASALGEKGLTYADSMKIRTRITEIGTQIQALPAMQAASEFGRRSVLGDVRAGNQNVLTTQAGLYGDNGAVESAGVAGYDVQRGIYADALMTVNNPAASVETRAQATLRADGAQVAALQTQAGTRQTVISRIQASSAANQAELNVNLTKAQFGSGADVRMAGAGLVAAFGVEQGRLTEQMNAPGTTVEQKLALRQQIAGLQGQQITLTESARDSGFQKDFISGYEITATQLAGQAQRQQFLPFSPGNMMQTSLKMLQNNQVGLKMLDEREADLKKAGTFSPERQMEIETQRQGLLTADAQQIAYLGNDLPNRLPGMMAGRASFSGRANSFQLAAEAVKGTANRSFGAMGGEQLREQDAFTAPFVSEGQIRPYSKTQAMNNGEGAIVAAIEKLTAVLTRGAGGGSGMRPNEGVGAISSAVYGKRANLDNGRTP